MPVTIRNAAPADRPAMIDLWVDAWNNVRPEIDFAARRDWFDRHLDALHARGTHIAVGLADGDRRVGFVTLDLASGEVDQLVTAAWAQRQGVGTTLLRHAKRLSGRGLVLSVNQFNAPALRLYEREGFQRVGQGISAGSGLPVWHMRWKGEEAG